MVNGQSMLHLWLYATWLPQHPVICHRVSVFLKKMPNHLHHMVYLIFKQTHQTHIHPISC